MLINHSSVTKMSIDERTINEPAMDGWRKYNSIIEYGTYLRYYTFFNIYSIFTHKKK